MKKHVIISAWWLLSIIQESQSMIHKITINEAENYCRERDVSATYPKRKIKGLYGDISQSMHMVLQRLRHNPFMNAALLYGPPGVGKTTFAEAIAAEEERVFYTIKVPDLVNKYQGSGAEFVRALFSMIRKNKKPAVILFDELQKTEQKDTSNLDWQNAITSLWQEIEKCNNDRDKLIYCIATTNSIVGINITLRDRFIGNMCEVLNPSYESRKKMIAQFINDGLNIINAEQKYGDAIAALSKEEGLSIRCWMRVVGEAIALVKGENAALTDTHLFAGLTVIKLDMHKGDQSFLEKHKEWIAKNAGGALISEIIRFAIQRTGNRIFDGAASVGKK